MGSVKSKCSIFIWRCIVYYPKQNIWVTYLKNPLQCIFMRLFVSFHIYIEFIKRHLIEFIMTHLTFKRVIEKVSQILHTFSLL
uniref:Uncharacterized protein n=1 Tax=Glossina morsitans morsitans TaxID=37546 RepID=A0A1B0FR49_GLOMM